MQSAPAAPAPPDPYKTAAAQTQGDVQSAIANSVMGNADVYTPYGSSTNTQTGTYQITDAQGHKIDVPKYTQTQTLSPEQQQLYNDQTALGHSSNALAQSQIDRLGGVLGKPISAAGLPAAVNSIGNGPKLLTSAGPDYFGSADFNKSRDQVVQALMSRIQPELDRSQSALDAKLANQGITPGSTAYTDANVAQGRTANDARMQAVLAGSQEQDRLFNEALQRGQFDLQKGQFANTANQQMYTNAQMGATFANTARERALQEDLAIRNQPINEISALMKGGQVTVPTFSPFQGGQIAGSTIGSNIMGSANMAQQQWQTQANMAAQNNAGIYGLGSSILGAGGKMMTGGTKPWIFQ